ncbi:MAG: hypothetical protein ACI81V_001502 [Lentimonas sp.]|jgi:hypothetical protein
MVRVFATVPRPDVLFATGRSVRDRTRLFATGRSVRDRTFCSRPDEAVRDRTRLFATGRGWLRRRRGCSRRLRLGQSPSLWPVSAVRAGGCPLPPFAVPGRLRCRVGCGVGSVVGSVVVPRLFATSAIGTLVLPGCVVSDSPKKWCGPPRLHVGANVAYASSKRRENRYSRSDSILSAEPDSPSARKVSLEPLPAANIIRPIMLFPLTCSSSFSTQTSPA